MKRKKPLVEGEPWRGATAFIQRTNGEILVGVVRKYIAGRVEIMCEWGTVEIPKRLIADSYYS